MTTGRIAGETVTELIAQKKPMTAANLARYRKTLDDSFVMKDLRKYKNMPEILHGNHQFFTTYPELVNRAMHTMLTVDGIDKKTKEKAVRRNFRQKRSLFGLLGDAFKMWRAFE
jgi:electron transfer flavoprotein-quinone oxidoreductase